MIEAVLPYPQIDPVLIHLGPFAVRWYAISYISGLVLGWWLILKTLRRASLWKNPPFNGKAPATADDIGDLFVWVVLGVIIGGRLGYDLFYSTIFCSLWTGPACQGLPMAFLYNPLRLIADWDGWVPRLYGMSFHGGLIGVAVAIFLFCRKRKLDVLQVGDLIATVASIGLFFGRIANFINGELWGKVTTSPLGMVFCNDTIVQTYGRCPAGTEPRYPSQLFEAALEGLLLFAIMQICLRKFRLHERPGLLTAIFFTGYGAARFFVEFFRDSESKIADWFTMGMALSLPMWAAAAFFFWYALKSPRAKT